MQHRLDVPAKPGKQSEHAEDADEEGGEGQREPLNGKAAPEGAETTDRSEKRKSQHEEVKNKTPDQKLPRPAVVADAERHPKNNRRDYAEDEKRVQAFDAGSHRGRSRLTPPSSAAAGVGASAEFKRDVPSPGGRLQRVVRRCGDSVQLCMHSRTAVDFTAVFFALNPISPERYLPLGGIGRSFGDMRVSFANTIVDSFQREVSADAVDDDNTVRVFRPSRLVGTSTCIEWLGNRLQRFDGLSCLRVGQVKTEIVASNFSLSMCGNRVHSVRSSTPVDGYIFIVPILVAVSG